jgi:YfiH family protein
MITEIKANMQATWSEGLLFYTFPHLAQQPGLIHAFSSRLGGVSRGCCASLNLAYAHAEDTAAQVSENWRRFGAAVGFDPARAVLTQQTHSVNIREAVEADAGRGLIRPLGYSDIDGLITAQPNLPLITYHADCAPLFFYAPRRRLIGLAHAGWRGTAAGMARAMVQQLAQRGCSPEELLAGVGPAAGPCCYQVGEEVAQHFAGLSDEAGPLLRPDAGAPGKYKLDLWRANRLFLLQAGLKAQNIMISGLCTVCNPQFFFSHRVQGQARGTMAAVMMLV